VHAEVPHGRRAGHVEEGQVGGKKLIIEPGRMGRSRADAATAREARAEKRRKSNNEVNFLRDRTKKKKKTAR
jgi:hypothetical protein